MTTDIEYVSNSAGKITSVLIPYNIWEEISSEIETRYFLDNPIMKKRILEARNRNIKISKEKVYEDLGTDFLDLG